MERNLENLKGDLDSAAAEFGLRVLDVEEQPDVGGALCVTARLGCAPGTSQGRINKAAACAMDVLVALGWRGVESLTLYPADPPRIVVRGVQP